MLNMLGTRQFFIKENTKIFVRIHQLSRFTIKNRLNRFQANPKLTVQRLSTLMVKLLLSNQFGALTRSDDYAALGKILPPNMVDLVISAANKTTLLFSITWDMSLMYIRNNKVLSTEPCGTPQPD